MQPEAKNGEVVTGAVIQAELTTYNAKGQVFRRRLAQIQALEGDMPEVVAQWFLDRAMAKEG